MNIGYNFKVMNKSLNGVWHSELFIDEASARAYANDCYLTGSVVVTLYARTRNGYTAIKEIKVNQIEAEARKNANIQRLAALANCEVIKV